jgi:putative transposase
VHEGFRQVALKPRHVERVNRCFGRVWVPKVGWVRFRASRPVPAGVKSYRVTRDRAGRWQVVFAHIPDPIAGPGDRSVVGIDRGVAVAAALSTGELLRAPGLSFGEAKRLKVLQQRLARANRGSNRRAYTKLAIAKLKAREADRRKAGTRVAQKRGLNRAISRSGWGLLAARLQHKALGPGRADSGCVHVATMLRVRACRSGEP